MFDFLTISRALSDENRVRILMALRQQAMCVCQVTAFLDLAPSTTSKHLSILRQSRLIVGRKRGRWVYYALAGAQAPAVVRSALDWVTGCLAQEPSILIDAARIKAIVEAEAACGRGSADDGGGHSPELHALAATTGVDDTDDPADADAADADAANAAPDAEF